MKHKEFMAIGFIALCFAALVITSQNTGCKGGGPDTVRVVVHDTVRVYDAYPPGKVRWNVAYLGESQCSLKLHLSSSLIEPDASGGQPCEPPNDCGESVSEGRTEHGPWYAWVECGKDKYYYSTCLDTVRVPDDRRSATEICLLPGQTRILRMIIKPQ